MVKTPLRRNVAVGCQASRIPVFAHHVACTAILVTSLVSSARGHASALSARPRAKRIQAGRLAASPLIDGRIHPGEWKGSRLISDFVQTSPKPGNEPEVETIVLVGFDESAFYLAFSCRQRNIAIHQAKSERDALSGADTDWVSVMLDPFLDRRTGYLFQVSAAGIQADAAISDDSTLDFNWDAVWSSAVSTDKSGWTVEISIPWTAFAHPTHGNRPWGFQLRRKTLALQEIDDWSETPRGSSGLVRHFGLLEGLADITRTLSLELRPYAASGLLLHRQTGSTSAGPRPLDLGFDMRYAITPEMTFSLSVNPDFGQVELDPTVVNLTKYEVYLQEKRPFFVENADLFKTPLSIFYSRRIGAAPPQPNPTTPDGRITEAASEAPIFLAAKLTGRPEPRWRIGALTAVVGPTSATEKTAQGTNIEIPSSQTAVFSTMRAVRQIGSASSLGLAMASVQRNNGLDAYVLSIDSSVRGKGPYSLTTQLATSLEAQHQGLAVLLDGGRTQVTGWRWHLTGVAFSRHLDLNQTGFLSRNDALWLTGQVSYLLPNPTKIHRSLSVGLTVNWADNLDLLPIRRRLVFWGSHTFASTWSVSYNYALRLPEYDDWTTSGGISVALPRQHLFYVSVASDSRRKVRGNVWSWVLLREDGSQALRSSASLSVQLGLALSIRLGFQYTTRKNWLQWVSSDKDNRPIFGRMDFDQAETSLHLQSVAAKRLTIQLYCQYVYAAARFRPDAYFLLLAKDEPQVQGDIGADWSLDTLKINLRLRWQLDSSTNLYLVATHIATINGIDPGFMLRKSLDRTWTEPATDIILFKLERRWLE